MIVEVKRGIFPAMRAPWGKRVRLKVDCRGRKSEDVAKNKKEAAGDERNEVDVTIYTDGSATEVRQAW